MHVCNGENSRRRLLRGEAKKIRGMKEEGFLLESIVNLAIVICLAEKQNGSSPSNALLISFLEELDIASYQPITGFLLEASMYTSTPPLSTHLFFGAKLQFQRLL